MAQEKYAILSENNDMVLCEAVLMDRRGAKMTMKIVDDINILKGLKAVKFHAMESYAEIYQGQIVEINNNIVSFGDVVNISAQMRREIKLKIRVETNLIKTFPMDKEKIPRAIPIATNDISCGGMGFVSKADLNKEDSYEVVIPITSNPISIDVEIMRKEFLPDKNMYVYGSKFLDLNIVGERLLREAIFKTQLRRHRRKIKVMEEKNK